MGSYKIVRRDSLVYSFIFATMMMVMSATDSEWEGHTISEILLSYLLIWAIIFGIAFGSGMVLIYIYRLFHKRETVRDSGSNT